MQVVSEPQYREEVVRDYEFGFVTGIKGIIVREEDTVEEFVETIVIETKSPPERFVVQRVNLLWMSCTERIVKYIIEGPINRLPTEGRPAGPTVYPPVPMTAPGPLRPS